MSVQSGRRTLGVALLALVIALTSLLIAWPGVALGHAIPDHAIPAIDSSVSAGPTLVEIWFTEEVAPEGFQITVLGPDGTKVDRGDAVVDLYDPSRQHATVSLQPNLRSGTYIVQWHTLSAIDQDATDGSFRFTIDPSASPVATAVAATPTPIPDAAPILTVTPSPPADVGGGNNGVAILSVIAVAVIVIVGGWLFWRRSHQTRPE